MYPFTRSIDINVGWSQFSGIGPTIGSNVPSTVLGGRVIGSNAPSTVSGGRVIGSNAPSTVSGGCVIGSNAPSTVFGERYICCQFSPGVGSVAYWMMCACCCPGAFQEFRQGLGDGQSRVTCPWPFAPPRLAAGARVLCFSQHLERYLLNKVRNAFSVCEHVWR